MEFSFNSNITKDFILSKVNQESIMSYYTNHNVASKKLYKSKLRQDNHVTVSYYKSKSGILYMHDFATNEQLDCWNVVMRLYNCNYYKALEIIAKDFGLLEDNKDFLKSSKPILVDEIKESETAKIQVQIKDFTKEELEWWNQFGITPKILSKYNIYSIKYIFLNDELRFTSSPSCPIYGYYFGKDNKKKEMWKCYFPLKRSYRFIGNLTQKILQGYRQLPKTGNLLVINKSMKDTAACYRLGIPSISPNSETTFPSKKQIEELKTRFKHILVVFDNDKPGLHNLWKVRKQYPDLNYFWIPKKYGAKDLTDLIKLLGLDEVKKLVNEFMSNYKFKL